MRLVPLNNTVAFKKLFRDPEILTTFVKDLIGIDMNITADNIELEKEFVVPMGAIKIKFDIFAEDPDQRVVVEIQKMRYGYHYDRFLHYHHAAIMELQKDYRSYMLNKKVYTIVWLTARSTDPLFQKGLITTHYHSEASDGEVLPLYPHRLYFINPSYMDESIPPDVADWLHLATESIYHSNAPHINLSRPIFQKATYLIEDNNITPEERAAIMDEDDYEHSRQIRYQEGVKEGIEQGTEQGIAAVARAMLAQGAERTFICTVTGLSEDDLNALQNG